MKHSRSALLLVGLLAFALPVSAQLFKRDYDDEIKLPDEEALRLPPAPKEQNLVPFEPRYVTDLSFFVDSESVVVGQTDRIVRYTLVIKSQSGASNVTYEALRCDTIESKVYAYGAPDGKWSSARDPKWQSFDHQAYRRTLFRYYFCPDTIVVGSVREAVEALKSGGHSRAPFRHSSDHY